MRKYITISTETRRALMKKYNVTSRTIWEACSFITRNKRGNDIRRDAMDMGGRYIEENFIPNCRTEFLGSGGIRQTFPARVEVFLEGGTAVIRKNDKDLERYDNVTLDGWGNILERAQHLSETGMFEVVIQ